MAVEKPLVIYVDNSPAAREQVRDALGQLGYQVLTAKHAADLERKFLRDDSLGRKAALFILEFDLPEMTGPQIATVLEHLHQGLREAPFLIYSAKAPSEVETGIRQAEELSFSFVRNYRGFVAKQEASLEGLVDRVRELVPVG